MRNRPGLRAPALVATWGIALAAVSLVGCGWLANLSVPTEIREKGLLAALREPMPLDGPDPVLPSLKIEHPAELAAAEERLEEFVAGLGDPTQRAAYVQARGSGQSSRTATFYVLFNGRDGGMGGDERIFERWRRLDRALAKGGEPELLNDRLMALAFFVARADADGAARLTEAIRDGWDPDSENWRDVIEAMRDPSDRVWAGAWTAASKKDLDNRLGRAVLYRLALYDQPPSVHPFATPSGIELLSRLLKNPGSPDEAYEVVQQLGILDDASRDDLWQVAKALRPGQTRIKAAELMLLLAKSDEAKASLVDAARDERYALDAWNALARRGALDRSTLPTGENLARAKAYEAVVEWSYFFVEATADDVELFPIASGAGRIAGEEVRVDVFRYRVRRTPAAIAAGAPAMADGLVVVDDRLALDPEEVDPEAISTSAGASMTIAVEEPVHSLDRCIPPEAIAEAETVGAKDLLDVLIAAFFSDSILSYQDPPGARADLLRQDERWTAFALPLDSLGLPAAPPTLPAVVEP